MTATQLAAGVNADGTYITPTGSNYIDASTSLADAAAKLDAAIKAVDNAHNGNRGNLQSQLDAEIARATAAEGANRTLINGEIARATSAESDLGDMITTNAQQLQVKHHVRRVLSHLYKTRSTSSLLTLTLLH